LSGLSRGETVNADPDEGVDTDDEEEGAQTFEETATEAPVEAPELVGVSLD
jgi:hypothetical protein